MEDRVDAQHRGWELPSNRCVIQLDEQTGKGPRKQCDSFFKGCVVLNVGSIQEYLITSCEYWGRACDSGYSNVPYHPWTLQVLPVLH